MNIIIAIIFFVIAVVCAGFVLGAIILVVAILLNPCYTDIECDEELIDNTPYGDEEVYH